jgi:putative transposase
MARPLRFVYPGAVYHIMARGDGGKKLFLTDSDHYLFLDWLDAACKSHGWRIHAWVLMSNHFHLLLETPEPNLVSGMKWLLGGFSQAWNRRYKRSGHVFQGRYKSIPVSGELASDPYHFRSVADYIHLNPARAKLVGGKRGPLLSYRWSSLQDYAKGRGPDWLDFQRVLDAFSLANSGRGRRAYLDWLEIRASHDSGQLPDEAMRALRRGWYLGEESFRDKLLGLITPSAKSLKTKGNHSGVALQKHDESAAEKIVQLALSHWGLADDDSLKESVKKGDPRKVAIAAIIKARTNASNHWISERLGMGHDRSVSRLVKQGKEQPAIQKLCREIIKMLPCED